MTATGDSVTRRRLPRMIGRDPADGSRSATPLELLFDLSFVVAFSVASDQLAHAIAHGHVIAGVGAFSFAMFATCWAWINFSWFASAYDTDDWFYRVTTMVQMIGVIILALGLPAVFASITEGELLDNRVVVIGYVIMRVALVVQWLRVARDDPARRATALAFAGWIIASQAGWVLLSFSRPSIPVFVAIAGLLYLTELAVPIIAERKSSGTPWHPHHIAERYGLLTIIALGEGVFGTVASVSALVNRQGWSPEAGTVVFAGIGLTFGLWWTYFLMPSGPLLSRYRRRAYAWGYVQILSFAAIAATGAGLHVAALVIEGDADVGTLGAIIAIVVPVLIFSAVIFLLYTYLMGERDLLHLGLFAGLVAMLVLATVLAASGAGLALCLVVVTLAPAVVVVGYETVGRRHQANALSRALG